MRIPTHVAIILDGNGRWAKSKNRPRNYGHVQGAKNVEVICEAAWNLGIKYLTVYAFSTENWIRPEDEVSALMKLLRHYFKNYLKQAMKNNMRVRIIGDRSKLDADIQENILNVETKTSANDGLNFQIAFNYGSRDEILRAARRIIVDAKAGTLDLELDGKLDEKLDGKSDGLLLDESIFSSYLDTAGIPDPDLLIRTSGEQRISNFLLWQLAYSELYFTPVPWPDFSPDELKKAIDVFNDRDRRYGGLKEDQETEE